MSSSPETFRWFWQQGEDSPLEGTVCVVLSQPLELVGCVVPGAPGLGVSLSVGEMIIYYRS